MPIHKIQVAEAVNTVLGEVESRTLPLKSKTDVTRPITVDSIGKKCYRDHVVYELVETDRKYVQDLKCLNELKGLLSRRGILTEDVIHDIFLNIGTILDFQQKFLAALESTSREEEAEQEWGLPFVHFEYGFDLYQPFLANQRRAAEIARREFEKITTANNNIAVDFKILDAVLLKPVSRLVKYHLILKVRFLRR